MRAPGATGGEAGIEAASEAGNGSRGRPHPRPLPGGEGIRTSWALGFLVLLPALFLAPALFTERVLLPLDILFLYPPWQSYASQFGITLPHNHLIADTILQNVSWKALAARGYGEGQAPLWNPEILAGQPFLAGERVHGLAQPPRHLAERAGEVADLVAGRGRHRHLEASVGQLLGRGDQGMC